MKAVERSLLVQVALLLSLACSAFALPRSADNGFMSLFEPEGSKSTISNSAAGQPDADGRVLVAMLVRGPRRLLLASPAPHKKNVTSGASPAVGASPAAGASPAVGDSAAVLPACRNMTTMTPACSAALQAQQSNTVLIIVIVCAVGMALIVAVIAYLVWQCHRSNKQVTSEKGTRETAGPAIKSGDPSRMAAAILQRHHELGHTVRFSLGFMKWDNIGQFGAATAGPCVMVVYYCSELRHEAADNLRWLIRDLRDLGQLGVPEAAPFGHNRTVYGAVAGLQLSMDTEDIQVLLQKCTQDGIAVHLPSGCWLEGTRDAALLPNKGRPPCSRNIQYRV